MRLLKYEIQFGYPNSSIAGVDEVGRGCLAGPVVACAVVLPSVIHLQKDPWLERVNDSKLLSPEVREELSAHLKNWAFDFHIGSASREEIDEINILRASHLAMIRAWSGLSSPPDWTLVDGHLLPRAFCAQATALVGGDRKSLSIAAASIIAKVHRDQLMEAEGAKYPHYGFEVHKGYPTPFHKKQLQIHGACPLHRRSFKPVSQLLGTASAHAEENARESLRKRPAV